MKRWFSVAACFTLIMVSLFTGWIMPEASAKAAGSLNTYNGSLSNYQITNQFMPKGQSRTKTKLAGGKPQYIVLHYVASPGSSAQAIADFFGQSNAGKLRKYQDSTGDITYATSNPGAGWKDIGPCKISSHYVIGQQGEVIKLVPDNEVAYHAGASYYNSRSIGIEVCHVDSAGNYNEMTYTAMVRLVADLAKKYNIPQSNIIRHYDVTGKWCPAKFAGENNAEWAAFKEQVNVVRSTGKSVNSSSVGQRVLKYKTPLMKGEDVKQLQQMLINLGFIPGTIDGVFGRSTMLAVKSFQSQKGLTKDGIVGSNTWAAMIRGS